MNLKEARALEQGDMVVTTDNWICKFIALDREKDLIVECKASPNGWVTMLRIQCTKMGPR